MNKNTKFNNFKDFGNSFFEGQNSNQKVAIKKAKQKNNCSICDMDHTTNNCPQSNTDLEVK